MFIIFRVTKKTKQLSYTSKKKIRDNFSLANFWRENIIARC